MEFQKENQGNKYCSLTKNLANARQDNNKYLVWKNMARMKKKNFRGS